MLSRGRHLGLLCLLIWTAVGCSDAPTKHSGDFAYVETFRDNYAGDVAARVNGKPIYAEELKRHADANPELKRRQVLDELIERELLFQKAFREIRGIYRMSGLARKRAMVETLLEREFRDNKTEKKQRAQFEKHLSRWREKASVKLQPNAWRPKQQ